MFSLVQVKKVDPTYHRAIEHIGGNKKNLHDSMKILHATTKT